MAYTTFSQNKNNQLLEPMFFGQSVNVARFDQQKYDIFEKLIEKQLSFFWRPEEVDVSRDRIDYQALPGSKPGRSLRPSTRALTPTSFVTS